MRYDVYAIRDEVEDSYFEPMLFKNDEVAKRYFADLCSKEGKVHDHREDFSIWSIGTYDMKEGQIEAWIPKLIERG